MVISIGNWYHCHMHCILLSVNMSIPISVHQFVHTSVQLIIGMYVLKLSSFNILRQGGRWWNIAKRALVNKFQWNTSKNKIISGISPAQHSKYTLAPRQNISTHDIDNVEHISSCLTWGRISTTCMMLVLRHDWECRHIFVSPVWKLARLWL